YRAKRIGNMRKSRKTRARVQERAECFEIDFTAFGHWRNTQYRTGLFAQQLPWHDIGMMLQPGQQDLVASLKVGAPPGSRNKVDGFGCAAREYDFAGMLCVKQAAYGLTRNFVEIGGMLRQPMYAAMDIGIRALVENALGLDDAGRLLRCSAIIEVVQRLAVYWVRQQRKVRCHIQQAFA